MNFDHLSAFIQMHLILLLKPHSRMHFTLASYIEFTVYRHSSENNCGEIFAIKINQEFDTSTSQFITVLNLRLFNKILVNLYTCILIILLTIFIKFVQMPRKPHQSEKR